MDSLRRNAFLLIFLSITGLACSNKESPSSILENSSEEAGTVTIYSSDQGTVAKEPATEKEVFEATALPIPKTKKRYPPPAAKPAPMAPRGPPIPPRYSLEPPPSKVKSLPEFKVERLGIWECDTYIDQYLRCINERIPRDQDGDFAKALAAKVRDWKSKLGSEAGRLEVTQACLAAYPRTKKAMQPYACVWR